ncbi:hypothetical protein AURDEDRAFT_175247 [Auricularia subglabra TFB-10046 SS5]|nr:hypothetical protein AURDEDRAFT_175247 [Auricularia subglabra TFB-10046 SS5]
MAHYSARLALSGATLHPAVRLHCMAASRALVIDTVAKDYSVLPDDLFTNAAPRLRQVYLENAIMSMHPCTTLAGISWHFYDWAGNRGAGFLLKIYGHNPQHSTVLAVGNLHCTAIVPPRPRLCVHRAVVELANNATALNATVDAPSQTDVFGQSPVDVVPEHDPEDASHLRPPRSVRPSFGAMFANDILATTAFLPKHSNGDKRDAVPRCLFMDLVDLVSTVDFAFYDPEVAVHDQRQFIEQSLAAYLTLASKQHLAPSALSEQGLPDPPLPPWANDRYSFSVSLGKFGQPSWPGSAWENFNPLRLWDNVDGGIIHRGTPLWIRLVEDAVKLPFESRSNAQRLVVSDGHRFIPRGRRKPVLPLDGNAAELDIWSLCAQNAVSMPLAVRKQYAYHRPSRTLYREWDAADVGIFLTIRSCSPPSEAKEAKRKREKSRPFWVDQCVLVASSDAEPICVSHASGRLPARVVVYPGAQVLPARAQPICQSQRAGEYAHQAAQVLHVANNQGQRGSPILNVIEGPDAWDAADDLIRAAVHSQEPLLLNVAHVSEWQEDTLPRRANMPIGPAHSPAAPDERISAPARPQSLREPIPLDATLANCVCSYASRSTCIMLDVLVEVHECIFDAPCQIALERASLDEINAVRTEHGLVAWGNIDPDGILLRRRSLPHLGIDRCIYMLLSPPPPV